MSEYNKEEMKAEYEDECAKFPSEIFTDPVWGIIVERIYRNEKPRNKFIDFLKKHSKNHSSVDGMSCIKILCHFSSIGYDYDIICSKCNETISVDLWEYW